MAALNLNQDGKQAVAELTNQEANAGGILMLTSEHTRKALVDNSALHIIKEIEERRPPPEKEHLPLLGQYLPIMFQFQITWSIVSSLDKYYRNIARMGGGDALRLDSIANSAGERYYWVSIVKFQQRSKNIRSAEIVGGVQIGTLIAPIRKQIEAGLNGIVNKLDSLSDYSDKLGRCQDLGFTGACLLASGERSNMTYAMLKLGIIGNLAGTAFWLKNIDPDKMLANVRQAPTDTGVRVYMDGGEVDTSYVPRILSTPMRFGKSTKSGQDDELDITTMSDDVLRSLLQDKKRNKKKKSTIPRGSSQVKTTQAPGPTPEAVLSKFAPSTSETKGAREHDSDSKNKKDEKKNERKKEIAVEKKAEGRSSERPPTPSSISEKQGTNVPPTDLTDGAPDSRPKVVPRRKLGTASSLDDVAVSSRGTDKVFSLKV